MPDVVAYHRLLERNPEETRPLLQDMLISVTNFFRDREAFESLEREVLPKIFEMAGEAEQIRVWSLACASGEEAYSLSILLSEQNALSKMPRPLQVFASDIDERAVNIARRGLYPESIITDVTPGRLRQYFRRDGNFFGVSKEIRDQVLFADHNVLRDPPFSKLHLICCRNLLIYFSREIQKHVFELLHYALLPGGYLFLGSAEAADVVPELFTPIDKKNRIYQAKKIHRYRMAPKPMVTTERLPQLSVIPGNERAERRKTAPQQVYQSFLESYALPSVLGCVDIKSVCKNLHSGLLTFRGLCLHPYLCAGQGCCEWY